MNISEPLLDQDLDAAVQRAALASVVRRRPARWRRGLRSAPGRAARRSATGCRRWWRRAPRVRPWLVAKGLVPLTGMLSVWPTTVTLPISSWLAAITWPIEAISGSKPSVSCGAGRAEELGVGPLDDERWRARRSRCLSAPAAGPPARRLRTRARARSRPAPPAMRQRRLSRGGRKISARSAGGSARASAASCSAWPSGRSERQGRSPRRAPPRGEEHPERHGEAARLVGGDRRPASWARAAPPRPRGRAGAGRRRCAPRRASGRRRGPARGTCRGSRARGR